MESRKVVQMNLSSGRNGDTHVEHSGEGGTGTSGGISVNTHTLPWVRALVGSCCSTQEPRLVLCDDLKVGEGRRVAQKGRDVCVLRGDLHCCTEETNTTCKAISPQIKHRLKRTKTIASGSIWILICVFYRLCVHFCVFHTLMDLPG